MSKQIVIAEQHRIAAVFSEDQIQEVIVAQGTHQVSDIYLGIVENILPGIDAAFVNIGDSDRNGFIHVSDLGPLKLHKTSRSITELLVPQQKVLVQVMKEPTGNKGPRLTGNVSLPGRYLVLMPNGRGVNLSRRIRSENERNRLRALAILIKPAGMGLVIRTEAEGMPEEAIIEDLETLHQQWENVMQEATTTRAPALLNRDDDFIQKVLRDVYNADVNRIVVDSHTGLKRVKQQLLSWGGGKAPQGVLIDHHRDRSSILEYFRINAAIREALKPRVDLPSGGYIIIERTEALTVIDVNSGSFTRSATARETVLWTNCEAATEIARQLRLRNIAGVIIVDFIDMDLRRDQLQVLEHFSKALSADKSRPQIAQLTELGLIELTRKRQGKNLYELFGQACPTCGGLGLLVKLPGEASEAEGEMIERPGGMALRDRQERSERAALETRALWEDRSEDSEDSEDGPDFNSRPPSLPDANRRRRRRPGGDEPTLRIPGLSPATKDFNVDPEPFAPSDDPAFGGRGGRPERGGRGRGRRGGGRELPALGGVRSEFSTPQPAVTENPPLPEPSFPKSVGVETAPAAEGAVEDRRGRGRRDRKPPSEPPELISVEMTPDEQDVYAWMGISPLVLTNQDVKNPKSALISVVLPGQAPLLEEIAVSAEPVPEVPAPDLPPAPAPVKLTLPPPTPKTTRVIGAIPAPPTAAIESAVQDEPPLPESAEPESAETEEGPVRRRRRRSSAPADAT
jgi:ribonuclease E